MCPSEPKFLVKLNDGRHLFPVWYYRGRHRRPHPLPLWDSPRMSVRKGQPLNPQGTRTSVTYAFFTGGK